MNDREGFVINNAYETSKRVLKLIENIENNELKSELPTKVKKEKWYKRVFTLFRNMFKK